MHWIIYLSWTLWYFRINYIAKMEMVVIPLPHFNCCSKSERNESKLAASKDIKLPYWNRGPKSQHWWFPWSETKKSTEMDLYYRSQIIASDLFLDQSCRVLFWIFFMNYSCGWASLDTLSYSYIFRNLFSFMIKPYSTTLEIWRNY